MIARKRILVSKNHARTEFVLETSRTRRKLVFVAVNKAWINLYDYLILDSKKVIQLIKFLKLDSQAYHVMKPIRARSIRV